MNLDWDWYYQPEKHGLRVEASLDASLSYEFSIVVLVREIATGDLYAAHDAGCSCPTPFENFTDLSDFTQVRSVEDVLSIVRNSESEYSETWTAEQKIAFTSQVRAAFRKARP